MRRIGGSVWGQGQGLTCDSMTRIKGQAGIKLGGLFRSGFWVRLRPGSGLALGPGSEVHVKQMKACPQLESVEDDC